MIDTKTSPVDRKCLKFPCRTSEMKGINIYSISYYYRTFASYIGTQKLIDSSEDGNRN